MKKLLWFVAVVAVVAAAWLGWRFIQSRFSPEEEIDIKTTRAELRESICEVIKVNGVVRSASTIEVKSEISGRIQELTVEDGDSVERGQLLLRLDQLELLSQKEELLRGMESARLRTAKAKRDFDRLNGLSTEGFVSQKDVQDARTELDLAKNSLEIQQARLQTLSEKISKTAIHAHHKGIVLNCDLTVGQVIIGASSVSQGTVLMNVADLADLIVETSINEVDVARLSRGMSVQISFDSIPQLSIGGTIRKVSPSARVERNVRVFPVEISCDKPDPRIKPGISANVDITMSRVNSVVGVMVSAVFSEDAEKVVFVKGSGAKDFSRRVVEVGINDADFVEIRSGLSEGEQVASTRPPQFQDDDKQPKESGK